ncbi:MAG: carboxylesterase/lipase family protein [Myxococcota bacterium]
MPPTLRAACCALLLAGLPACGGDAPPAADPASQRSVRSGAVVGFEDDGAHVWRGIPFAAPARGDLRWAPPAPPQPWQGVREALDLGPACPQLDQGGEPTGDEDCLVLNVFAPRFAPQEVPGAGSRLPVMVFIHGGGNSIGSAEVYDAARLARDNGVVVVTVHYRLGVFGWFSHRALRQDAPSPAHASGNWGTLDLVAALEWVRDDVAAFGGDPERVTVFGESAGGVNVYSLLMSPRARGLFQRAISQSGFATSFTRAQAENRTDDPQPGEAASSGEVLLSLLQRDGRAGDRDAAKALADGMSLSEIADYLRGKSAFELLGPFQEDGVGMGGMYVAPFVLRDGSVIPDRDPLALFRGGDYNRVPTVLGTNRDEHKLFLAFMSPHVRRVLGVPVGFHDQRRYDLLSEYGAKLWKASGADEPAAAMRARQGPSVWGYRFDWDELAEPLWIDLPRLIGAGHAMELFFVFGGTRSDFARWVMDDLETAERLSAEMRSYWAALAARGDPGRGQRGELPRWTAWDPAQGAPKFMVFDSPSDGGLRMSDEALTRDAVLASVATDERIAGPEERCEIYRTFVQWSDALTPQEYAELPGCRDYPLLARTAFEE